MFRKPLVIIMAALLVLAGRTGAATIDVYVYSFDFSINPNGQPIVDPVITVGDSIRWVWQEGNHTTTSVAGIPEVWNANISSGSPTFSHTFTNIGTWHFYCIPHGFDNGEVREEKGIGVGHICLSAGELSPEVLPKKQMFAGRRLGPPVVRVRQHALARRLRCTPHAELHDEQNPHDGHGDHHDNAE